MLRRSSSTYVTYSSQLNSVGCNWLPGNSVLSPSNDDADVTNDIYSVASMLCANVNTYSVIRQLHIRSCVRPQRNRVEVQHNNCRPFLRSVSNTSVLASSV